MRAGAARRVIAPGLRKHAPVYPAGFDNNHAATGVHNDLLARCLALATDKVSLVIRGVERTAEAAAEAEG